MDDIHKHIRNPDICCIQVAARRTASGRSVMDCVLELPSLTLDLRDLQLWQALVTLFLLYSVFMVGDGVAL